MGHESAVWRPPESQPTTQSGSRIADFFKRFPTQVVMSKTGGKGVPSSYGVGDLNTETIVFHRLILGHKQTAACSTRDANQPQAVMVQQSLRECFFIPDAQPE